MRTGILKKAGYTWIPRKTRKDLKRFLDFHHENLQLVRNDLRLQEIDVVHVYVVDFQEIYTYMHGASGPLLGDPSSKATWDYNLIDLLFSDLQEYIIFCGGTWKELIDHLVWFSREVSKETHHLRTAVWPNDHLSFLEDVINQGSSDVLFQHLNEMSHNAIHYLKNLVFYRKNFEKLLYLLSNKNYFQLEPFLKKKPFKFNSETKQEILNELNVQELKKIHDAKIKDQRYFPRREKANQADATNLATIMELNKYFREGYDEGLFKKCYNFCLLTHTKTLFGLPDEYVFEVHRHVKDEDVENKEKISVLRTPASLFYKRKLIEKYATWKEALSNSLKLRITVDRGRDTLDAIEDNLLADENFFQKQIKLLAAPEEKLKDFDQWTHNYATIREATTDSTLQEITRTLIRSEIYNREVLAENNEKGYLVSEAKKFSSVLNSLFSLAQNRSNLLSPLDSEEELVFSLKSLGLRSNTTKNEKAKILSYKLLDFDNSVVFQADVVKPKNLISIYWENVLSSYEILDLLQETIKKLFECGVLNDSTDRSKNSWKFGIFSFSFEDKMNCYPLSDILDNRSKIEGHTKYLRINCHPLSFCAEIFKAGSSNLKIGIIVSSSKLDQFNVRIIKSFFSKTVSEPHLNLVIEEIIHEIKKAFGI